MKMHDPKFIFEAMESNTEMGRFLISIGDFHGAVDYLAQASNNAQDLKRFSMDMSLNNSEGK